jgi:tetratricopeptide (TPR) repeat protein
MAPQDACAHFGLSDAYHLKGELDLALIEIDEAMRLKPDWPYYHSKKGKILESAGDLEAAIAQFERAMSLKPDCEDALANFDRLRGKRKAAGRRGDKA